MRYWTLGEVREKIESDLDLLEEPDILSPNELVGYLNDAIDTVEQHFIRLGDYFLSVSTKIDLFDGQSDYDLPDDIYATKIRQILCDNEYIVRMVKDIRKIPVIADSIGDTYKYLLINSYETGGRPRIRLFPTPLQGEGQFLEIYYTRNANRILPDGGDAQVVDIPEAMLYIITFIKMRIYEKEKNYGMYQAYKEELAQHEQNLINALAARVDDEDNTIAPDTEIYTDMMYV